MISFASILRLLPAVGPVVAALPEFKSVFDQIVSTFHGTEQAALKETYAALIAENDAGHARLQTKLDDAAKL